MKTPLLSQIFNRLRANARDSAAVARTLAESVCRADGAVAAGVFLRDYSGEALYLAARSPEEEWPGAEPPGLAADKLDDPLCYCLHTGAPGTFSLTDEPPPSVRLVRPAPGGRFYKIHPVPEPGEGFMGAVLALYEKTPSPNEALCRYVCLYAGALLGLDRGKKQNGYALQSLEEQIRHLKEDKNEQEHWKLVGDSPATQALRAGIDSAARSGAPLFITGETGTGKSLLARLIHNSGKRSGGPFLEINCGALPANLLESELFGHVRGAFSGAVAHHKGLLRSAEGGTVLLDEIGEMAPQLQVVLLHVLQERKVRPVGGTKFYSVNMRVIAATNCDVELAMREGRLRRDLYHRLAVLRIHMPPLRERREDIPALCSLFLERCARKQERDLPRFTPEANLILMGLPYPGNVRELEALVEQAVSNSPRSRTELGPESLTGQSGEAYPCISLADFRAMQDRQTEWFVRQAMNLYKGDQQACARALGVHIRTIRRHFRKEKAGAGRSSSTR